MDITWRAAPIAFPLAFGLTACGSIVSEPLTAQLCSSQKTAEGLKAYVLADVAARSPSARDRLYRMGEALVATIDQPSTVAIRHDIGRVDCSGVLRIEIPPPLSQVFGGKLELSSDVIYSIQRTADSKDFVYSIAGHDEVASDITHSIGGTENATAAVSPRQLGTAPQVPAPALRTEGPRGYRGASSLGATAGDIAAAFYYALGRRDWLGANGLLVPEKRNQPAFNPASLERFYGSMRQPIQLDTVRQLDGARAQVTYRYAVTSRICNGRAIVVTSMVGDDRRIESILAGGGC